MGVGEAHGTEPGALHRSPKRKCCHATPRLSVGAAVFSLVVLQANCTMVLHNATLSNFSRPLPFLLEEIAGCVLYHNLNGSR